MPALFIYLVKVNIALIIFCLGYYAVLRHLTFYTLNRAYLVTAIVFSTLYPFINLSAFINRHQEIARPVQVVINWQAPAHTLVKSPAAHNEWHWLQLVFWAGVLLFTVRLAMQLLSLYRLHKQSEPVQFRQYMIRVIKGDINPFSFWQNIYVNPANHPPGELEAILEHEQIHVNDWHTLDILLGEVSTIFYWFNPGIWLIKKAIRENIEFITDRKILQNGIDRKAYQYSLINVNFEARSNAIVNHFNISTIKKRIMMMNTKKSSSLNLTRYMLLVPVVIALLLVFSVSKAELNKTANSSKHLFNTAVKKVTTKLNISYKDKEQKSADLLNAGSQKNTKIEPSDTAYHITYETAKADTNKNKSITLSAKTIAAKPDTFYYKDKNGVTMAVPVSGVVKKPISGQSGQNTKVSLNGITYIKPKNNLVPSVNKSVIVNGLVKPLSSNSSNKTTKMKLNGVTYTKPKADTIRAIIKKRAAGTVPDTLLVRSSNKADEQVRVSFGFTNKVKGINTTDTIKNNTETLKMLVSKIDIDKHQPITKIRLNGVTMDKVKTDSLLNAMRGWKVEKNGVVTKAVQPQYFAGSLFGAAPIDFKDKLIIIDGKEATEKQLKKLSAAQISSISNMRRDTALAQYGDKAKNGVITITTKKEN